MTYYNTTNETGSTLKQYEKKAQTQEEEILDMFKVNGLNGAKSPSWIYKAFNEKYPITSVRRALTNLTNQGKLRKTKVKVTGLYGRPEYLWKLKTEEMLPRIKKLDKEGFSILINQKLEPLNTSQEESEDEQEYWKDYRNRHLSAENESQEESK